MPGGDVCVLRVWFAIPAPSTEILYPRVVAVFSYQISR